MSTPTKTSPAKIARLRQSIREQERRLKTDALSAWQRWAQAVATGGEVPTAREVVDAAHLLGIEHAASQLQADADAIVEVRRCETAAAVCRKAVADKLEAFGGRVENLEAAVAAAKAEYDRLAEILAAVQDGCSEGFWRGATHEARRGHPLIWPGVLPLERDDDEDAFNVEVE